MALLAGVAVTHAAIVGAALAGGPTKPIPPAATMRPPMDAFQRFESLVAADRPNDLPRLSDPAAAPVLRTLWAAAGTGPDPTGYGPKTVKDDVIVAGMVKSTLEWFEIHVLDTYLVFPTPLPHPEDFDMARPLPAGFDAERLAQRFGPEVAGSLAAAIVEVADMSAVIDVSRKLGGEAAHVATGAHKARAPSLRLVSLAQTFMRAPAFRPDDTARVAAAFADHGGDFATILSQQDRASIASSFAAQQLPDGPARRDIARFVALLHTTPCGPLCSAAD